MVMKSMTAFARAERTAGQMTVTTEIRSLNSRYLDVVLRLPHGYHELEEQVKNMIAARVVRGRLEVKVQVRDESEDAYAFEIDGPKARAYYDALSELARRFGLDAGISLDHVLSAGGVIAPAEAERDLQACWPLIEECLGNTLDDLVAMRQKEGDHIARDFADRLAFIRQCLERIKHESSGLVAHYQERLRERIQALTQGMVEIDPARIAQEAAFLADRSDISEELVRVESHLALFRTLMQADEPAGRKLTFLLQELNREFNTMGAKTGKAEVSHVIVDVKSELEKIREQVQNIE